MPCWLSDREASVERESKRQLFRKPGRMQHEMVSRDWEAVAWIRDRTGDDSEDRHVHSACGDLAEETSTQPALRSLECLCPSITRCCKKEKELSKNIFNLFSKCSPKQSKRAQDRLGGEINRF